MIQCETNKRRQTEATLANIFAKISELIVSEQPVSQNIKYVIKFEMEVSKVREKYFRLLAQEFGSIGDVCRMAVDVFENEQNATVWIFSPNHTLGWKSPISILDNVEGVNLVFQTLGRIQWGVFT